jgi:hypothetical protein
MGIFDELIAEKANEYKVANVLTEMEGGDMGGGAMGSGDMSGEMDAELATADTQDASTNPPEGATVKPINYNKPYQDLADLLYKAIRVDYDALPPEAKNTITDTIDPDVIDNDEKGAKAFYEWKKVYEHFITGGVDPNEDIPVGPAVSMS